MRGEHYDLVIIGAGLSGVGMACHLARKCPGKRYIILEGRAAMGGTWDLFRYPGIRSDSDMFTFGYAFKPWISSQNLADGPSILNYVRETARENGIEPHIRLGHRVKRASWSSAEACWTVEAERVARLAARLDPAVRRTLARAEERLGSLEKLRRSFSPDGPLERGFARVHHADGTLARSAKGLASGEGVRLVFADGERAATVDGTPRAPVMKKPKDLGPPQGDLF